MQALSVVVRVLAVVLVVLSPWLAPLSRRNDGRSVVYVVDRSSSMGTDALEDANLFILKAYAARDHARIGVVAFDTHAAVISPVGDDKPKRVEEGPQQDRDGSDLASGLRLAVASLPTEGHRSVVILSDARPTRGDALLEVKQAAEAGIRVDVVPLIGTNVTKPLVTSVKARTVHAAEHQPVALDVEVAVPASVPTFTVHWTRDGVALPARRQWTGAHYKSPPGDGSRAAPETEAPHTHHVDLVDPDPPPGVHVYEVSASAQNQDPTTAALTTVTVDGKAYAVVFSSAGEAPPVLAAALKEAGLETRSLPIERANDPSSYSGSDIVVLSDVRVSGAANDDAGLTRTGQAALVEHIQQGGGLLVTGGVFGLAPEYAGTPLARAIPVEIEDRGHVEDPPVALAIMLDRSGSMGATVGAHTKIELAIEASLAAADVLRPTDQLALGSVDTETHWDIPLGGVDRLNELRAQVRRVTAGGGGIYVFTALKDAYNSLATVKMPVRHVILFSDTSDSEEQEEQGTGKTCEALAKEYRAKGITTTVVGIGEAEAPHTPFLRRLAAASGGRFYITSEGTDLRRIFLSETRVLAQSNLREKSVRVAATGAHPVLEGVDTAKLPALAAFVETGRRAGADTALVLEDGRPMLATWRYGLGKVGAITTDLYEGWGAWANVPEGAQTLKQTVRHLLRQKSVHRADARLKLQDRVVDLELEMPEGATEEATAVELFAIEKSGASHKIAARLEKRGPGRWTVRGMSNGEPVVIARARDSRGALVAEAVAQQDRVPELSGDGADMSYAQQLARAGDGRLAPTPEQSLARTSKPGKELTPSWPYALLAGAILVVLDLILRRFGTRARRVPAFAM